MGDRRDRAPRNTRRTHPYERAGGEAAAMEEDEEPQDFETPSNSMKVSSSTDVRALAQSITAATRSNDGDLPALLTIGNHSINQACKGIAVSRSELNNEGTELSFQPAFRHVNRTRSLIAFYLTTHRAGAAPRGEDVELTVGAQSKIIAVAGAIAGKIREGKNVHLTAIGVDAVTNAVLAAGNARLYLEKDGMDIKVQPEFTRVEKNGQQMNALRFTFVPENI